MKSSILLLIVLSLFVTCTDTDRVISPDELPDEPSKLESMLDDGNLDNDTRLAVYNKLALKLWNVDPSEALRYTDLQLELAKQVENHEYWGRSFYVKGLVYRNGKDYKVALENYLKASDRFERAGLGKRIAHCQSNIGEIFQYNNFHREAIPYFEKAAEYYRASQQSKYRVNALHNLAISHWKKKNADLKKTADIYTAIIAEQLALKDVDHDYIVKLYTNYGLLNIDLENFATGIAQYENALEHAKGTEREEEYRARLYSNLAEAHMFQGEDHYPEAVDYIAKVQELKGAEQSDSRFTVQILNIQGELAMRLGEHEKALALFEEAAATANKEVVNEALQETLELMDRAQQAYLRAGGKLGYADAHRLHELGKAQERAGREFLNGVDRKELLALLQRTVDGYHHDRKEARLATERDDAILFGWLKIIVTCLLGGLALGWVNLTATKKVRGMGERVNEMKENVRQMTERVERAKNGEKWTELVRTTLSGIRNDLEENQATWIDRSAYLRFDDATDTDGPRNGDGNTP